MSLNKVPASIWMPLTALTLFGGYTVSPLLIAIPIGAYLACYMADLRDHQ